MICPKCGSTDMKAWVPVEMYVDADDYPKITKKVIAKKTTELWSVNHDRVNFVCRKCCYATTIGGEE